MMTPTNICGLYKCTVQTFYSVTELQKMHLCVTLEDIDKRFGCDSLVVVRASPAETSRLEDLDQVYNGPLTT